MLGKLIKHDLKSIGKIIFPMTLMLLIVTALGSASIITVHFIKDINNQTASSVLLLTCLSVLALSIVAVVAYYIISYFMVLQKFYKSMYTDEGYLTFTLPTTANSILMSKTVSAIIWSVFYTVAAILAFAAIIFTAYSFSPDVWGDFFGAIKTALHSMFGEHLAFPLALFGLNSAFSFVYGLIVIFLSITIGAIVAKRHKVLAAIGMYFAISTITSVVSSILSMLFMFIYEKTPISGSFGGLFIAEYDESSIAGSVSAIFNAANIFSCVLSAILIVAAYIFCRYLIKNKLNLP